jgi:hypothetical protein
MAGSEREFKKTRGTPSATTARQQQTKGLALRVISRTSSMYWTRRREMRRATKSAQADHRKSVLAGSSSSPVFAGMEMLTQRHNQTVACVLDCFQQ